MQRLVVGNRIAPTCAAWFRRSASSAAKNNPSQRQHHKPCELILADSSQVLEKCRRSVAEFEYGTPPDEHIAFLSNCEQANALITIVGVPWDATMCSFEHTGRSVHRTPERLLNYSRVIDEVDVDTLELGLGIPRKYGIHYDLSLAPETVAYSTEAALLLRPSRPTGDEPPGRQEDEPDHTPSKKDLDRIHELWRLQATALEAKFDALYEAGRVAAVFGGDHMSSYGAIKSFGKHCAAKGETFGILQFDAHMDLYEEYEHLRCSHACAMKRVLDDVDALDSFVAVGIRELNEMECKVSIADSRHRVFTAADLRRALGTARWHEAVQKIVSTLPRHVWVTFDIDGLDLSYCQGTGTPVPGGLSYHQAVDILTEIHRSGRVLCGWDLVEVGDGAAGVDVGARLAYKMAGLQMLGVGATDEPTIKLRTVDDA